MRRVYMLCVGWAAAVGLLSGCAALAVDPPLPPPVSVGPVQVKAVRWLAEGYNPVWAADGSFFVVSRWKKGFFRYSADGSRQSRLGKNSEGFCDLSPDGKSVLYCQTRSNKGGQTRYAYGVGLMRTDGTGRRLVNKNTGFAKWSPDGRYFLCQTEPHQGWQERPVFVYDRAGKLVRRLDYAVGPPSWSGDSQYLAYVGKAGKIYLARGDGSSPKVGDQPTGGEPYARLWWSPRGHNLLYAWNKDRYWVPTSPLCYLAPGSTPIEMCDTSRTVTWAPTGDRAAALDGQGMLTVFAFPGGKAPEARSDHEVGREGVKYVWSGDGRSLLYATREGVWCATEGVEEDRPLNLSMAFYPHAALAGDCVVGLEPPARSGSESEWGRPWVVDWRGGDAFPLYPKPDAYCSSYKIAPACAGRALIVDFGRPLLFRVTPRQ